MLAGHESEYQAIKAGAQEYLKKHDCTAELLHTTIDNAIEYMYLQSALHDIEVQQAARFHIMTQEFCDRYYGFMI
jgi:DNA-binding NarL/FixJ family response regulator